MELLTRFLGYKVYSAVKSAYDAQVHISKKYIWRAAKCSILVFKFVFVLYAIMIKMEYICNSVALSILTQLSY